jgi:hypothetical protein
MASQNLTLKIDVNATDAAAKIQGVVTNLKQLGMNFNTVQVKANEAGEAANNAANHFNNAGKSLLTMNVAANAISGAFRFLTHQWKHALDVNLELTAAQRLLNASTEDGGRAFDWVKHKAYEYGLAVSQLAHDYGIYIASAKASSLTMKDQNYIFESVIQTVSALGMSTEESGRIFLALREMLAKNVLTSQELASPCRRKHSQPLCQASAGSGYREDGEDI